MRARSAGPVALLALAVGTVFGVTTAAAHASLVSSTPEDGAALTDAPEEVVLQFDEELLADFSQVAVIDEAENHFEEGEPETAGDSLTQAVTDLPSGQYRITYRVSGDGHPVTGVVAFTIEPTDAADTASIADPGAAGEPDGDGAPLGTIAMAVTAVVLVGAAGMLLARRRSAGDDQGASPDGP